MYEMRKILRLVHFFFFKPRNTKMTDTKPSREELRKKLREKIGEKRTHQPITKKNIDIGGELLRQGVDDPEILNMAKSIGSNPNKALDVVKELVKNLKDEKQTQDDDDDEELPPSPTIKMTTNADLEDDDEGLPP